MGDAQNEGRLFPDITDNFYGGLDAPTAPDKQAATILDLARRRLGPWQRIRAKRQQGVAALAALLGLHRAAFEAERAFLHDRADFYWSEFYALLPVVWPNDQAWEAALSASGPTTRVNDIGRLRSSVATEIIRDCHYAFSAAFDTAGAADARADWHLLRALEALHYSALPPPEQKAFGDVAAARIRTQLKAGRVAAAHTLSAALIEAFPQDSRYQSLRIQTEFKQAIDDSGGDDVRVHRLQKAINQMTVWRGPFEDHTDLYEALGALYLSHAIASANVGSVSEGLLDIAKAEVAHPGLAGLAEVKAQLTTLMRDLQAQVSAIEASLAVNPNARLNADGRRLQADSRRGFEPASEWPRSDDCRSMTAGRLRGQTRTIWRDLGLPIESWTLPKGSTLILALSEVLREPPANAADLGRAWHDRASQHELDDLEPDVVVTWLEHRLGFRADAALPAPALITLAASEKRAGAEPLSDWITSQSARRVRWQLGVASVLAMLALAIFGRDAYRDRVRGQAWQALQEATTPSAVVDAAERFFAVGRPHGEPADRERAVWAGYAESMVRSLAESAGSPTAETGKHVARFAATAGRAPQLASRGE